MIKQIKLFIVLFILLGVDKVYAQYGSLSNSIEFTTGKVGSPSPGDAEYMWEIIDDNYSQNNIPTLPAPNPAYVVNKDSKWPSLGNGSQWISSENSVNPAVLNNGDYTTYSYTFYLINNFSNYLTEGPEIDIVVSADDVFEVFLNSNRISSGTGYVGGYNSAENVYEQELIVTSSFFQSGENTLEINVKNTQNNTVSGLCVEGKADAVGGNVFYFYKPPNGTVMGRVMHEELNTPVSGVYVELIDHEINLVYNKVVDQGYTDVNGYYQLFPDETGDHDIRIVPNHQSPTGRKNFYIESPVNQTSTMVNINNSFHNWHNAQSNKHWYKTVNIQSNSVLQDYDFEVGNFYYDAIVIKVDESCYLSEQCNTYNTKIRARDRYNQSEVIANSWDDPEFFEEFNYNVYFKFETEYNNNTESVSTPYPDATNLIFNYSDYPNLPLDPYANNNAYSQEVIVYTTGSVDLRDYPEVKKYTGNIVGNEMSEVVAVSKQNEYVFTCCPNINIGDNMLCQNSQLDYTIGSWEGTPCNSFNECCYLDNSNDVNWTITNIATSVVNTYNTILVSGLSPGEYDVDLSLNINNDCSANGFTGERIYVYDLSQNPISISDNSSTNCNGSINFTANYTQMNGNPSHEPTYTWSFGDGSPEVTAKSPSHTYDEPGNYNVVLTSDFKSCTLTNAKTITIRGAEINTPPSSICLSQPLNLSYTSYGTGFSSVEWNFGDAFNTTSTSISPQHTYDDPYDGPGTKTITLTAYYTNPACTTITTKQVEVYDENVTLTAPTDACVDEQVSFAISQINSGNPGSGPIFDWDFGDGNTINNSTSTSVNHTYSTASLNPNPYPFNLDVKFSPNCVASFSQGIYIDDPTADIVVPNEICSDEEVTIDFTSSSAINKAPISVTADLGDGSAAITSLGSVNHIYSSLSSANLALDVVYPGCSVSDNKTVNIDEGISRSISISSPQNLCLGKPVNYTLSGDVADATSISWDFGNGQNSSASNPQALYTSNGTYTVSASATYAQNCVSDNPATDEVIVRVADFDFCASCAECIGSFAPEAGGKYVLSAWVKEKGALNKTSYSDAGIRFFYEGDDVHSSTFKAKGPIIDGWQQIEQVFDIPASTTAIQVELVNSGSVDVYFDDIRIHPFDANLKSFVYDPITMRLKAELDENNYATFYEYDEDGNLIRIKKETDRGVKTIQETVKRVKQTN